MPINDNKDCLVDIKPKKTKDNQVNLPRSLDIYMWAAVSEQFAKEKQRIFLGFGRVWRKFCFDFFD